MRLFREGLWLNGEILTSLNFLADETVSNEPIWLLSLHGFMQSGKDLHNSLSRLNPDIRIVTIDFPGHGKSQSCHDPRRFGARLLIEDIIMWLDVLQLDKIYIHGYSMGGRLSWQLLKWLSEQEKVTQNRFKGFILESAHPGYLMEEEKVERRELDESRALQIALDFDMFYKQWGQNELFQSPLPTHQMHDPKSYAACLRGFGNGMLNAVQPGELDALSIPILLMAGEQDSTYLKLMQKMSESSSMMNLKVIPSAGHRCWQDNSKVWAEQINRFILQ